MATRLLVVAGATVLAGGSGCSDLDVVTNTYANMAEVRQAGAVERGWLPDIIPAGAHDIREAHDEAVEKRRWGLFSFTPGDAAPFRARLGSEMSFVGIECRPPARIEWWPVLLRGALDAERVAASGLKGHWAGGQQLIFAVNWNQRRAYYWSLQDH